MASGLYTSILISYPLPIVTTTTQMYMANCANILERVPYMRQILLNGLKGLSNLIKHFLYTLLGYSAVIERVLCSGSSSAYKESLLHWRIPVLYPICIIQPNHVMFFFPCDAAVGN